MAKLKPGYQWVEVENYRATFTSGLHGEIHVRPVEGQGFATDLRVACRDEMKDITLYPVGTHFRIKAKLVDYETGGQCLYTYHGWDFEVLGKPDKSTWPPSLPG